MRKYGKWLLVLGVVAVCPSMAQADGFLSGLKAGLPFTASAEERAAENQALAERVAGSLKAAALQAYDVEIEADRGLVRLEGSVRDITHRALATQVISGVPGVRRVENNLRFVPPGPVTQTAAQAPATQPQNRVQRAAFTPNPSEGSGIQQTAAAMPAPADNQKVAEAIGSSLSRIGLVGYDIEVRYNKGEATLNGSVATVAQRNAAGGVTSQVPGVRSVINNLQVNGPVTQASYNPLPMGAPAGMRGPGPGPMPMPAQMQAGVQPYQMAAPSPTGTPVGYSTPHLPSHAWPAYAQYPNSAAVTYPTQYSASAFPYIGPFYPYPQVPLGWREVSLEWDDGYWQLNFNKEKDKWYWLLSPKNW